MNKRSILQLGAIALGLAIPGSSFAQCGTTVYDPGGSGGNYGNNANYTVTYCPTNPGDAVTLTFTMFNTEANYDFVRIYNGPNTGSPLLGITSGTGIPGPYTSTHPSGCLTLNFTSDISITYAGWVANITCAPLGPPPSVCNTTVYDPGGASGNYSNNTNYTVTYCPDDPADPISMVFTMFSLENNYDNLTIYNGPTTGSPVIGTYTGTTGPGTVTSTHPTGCLTLVFTSDISVTYPGWAATVNCGTPEPPDGDCVYTLNLMDSFGDGWGTSNVGVSINGGPYTYYTVTGSWNQVLIGVDIGDVIVLTYNASGTWQGENSYTLGMGSGVYFSSGTSPAAGISFTQVVTCDPPPAPQQDCLGSATICSGQTFNNNSNNTGLVADLNSTNQGCLAGGERQGTWYVFSPSAAGTVGFSLTPVGTTDYDFAVWGPYPPGSSPATICPPAGPPARCSFDAPGPYTTGMTTGAGQNSEGAAGTGWVNSINVQVGEVYVLYIDNFSISGQQFGLTWQLTNGASLDCTVLPVELTTFRAVPAGDHVQLTWNTMTEFNSDRFEVEHSLNGADFALIGTVGAAGTSQHTIEYAWPHANPRIGVANHYRLKQVDMDGTHTYTPIETVWFKGDGRTLVPRPNPAQDMLFVDLLDMPVGKAFIEVLDASGRTIRSIAANQAGEARVVQVPLHGLEAGSYTVRLVGEQGAELGFGRFVKQ